MRGREGRSGYISQCNRWEAPGEEGEGGKIVFPDSFSREIQSEVNPSSGSPKDIWIPC